MGIKMDDLTSRMNAGVGAPGPDTTHRLISDAGNSMVKAALNTGRVVLNLPAIVVCSVVFKTQRDTVNY